MNVDDASQKWCPFARVQAEQGNRKIQDGQPLRQAACLAHQCMAFRKDIRGDFYCGLVGPEDRPA